MVRWVCVSFEVWRYLLVRLHVRWVVNIPSIIRDKKEEGKEDKEEGEEEDKEGEEEEEKEEEREELVDL